MDERAGVADLVQTYRDILLEMHDCRRTSGGSPRWNDLVDQLQAAHLGLRQSAEGRDAITGLVGHECLTVRQWSATHALAWAPHEARAELEREAADGGPGSFEARMTLRELDSGRLDTGWLPE